MNKTEHYLSFQIEEGQDRWNYNAEDLDHLGMSLFISAVYVFVSV